MVAGSKQLAQVLELREGEFTIGRLSDVLCVPKLAYNLLSVTELGKGSHSMSY